MRVYIVPFILFVLLIVNGCMGSTEQVEPVKEERDEYLRIGYFTEERFEQRYAELLQVEMPDLRYEILPTNELVLQRMSVAQWSEKYQADLIYIPSYLFQEFVRQNFLVDLNPWIQSDDYPIDSLVPSVIHLARLYGNGNLYGLPPTFYSRALIFDKDRFDQMQVEYASDLMSWEDIIMLASRFEKGLSLPYPTMAHWIVDVGRTMNWDIHDENGSLTMNTKEWEMFFELVKEPLQKEIITFNDPNQQAFLSGEYAMALITYDDYHLYIESRLNDHNWELVTAPINPANPDINYHLSVNGFFSIPESSQNVDAAWELIKLLMSKDTARWEYRMPYGFSTADPAVFINDTDQIEAFYKLGESEIPEMIPDNIYAKIHQFVTENYDFFWKGGE